MPGTASSRALSQRQARRQVLLGVEITLGDGSPPTKHRMKDLSASGARIDRAARLEPGAAVRVSVGALQGARATVVWVRGDAAGLHFEPPIDPDAARSKALVTAVKPPEPLAPLAEPPATAGWIADLTNPYQRRRKPD